MPAYPGDATREIASAFETLPRGSVVSEVARRLLERFTSGDIEPGTRLPPERALAESLGVADRVGRTDRPINRLTMKDAVLMGLAQAMALIPGVSRSGATISMGRFLGFDREAATRFAFLLAIPAVVGAGIFELKEIPNGHNDFGWGPTITATVVSFVVGYAAIAWLLRYVSTRSYTPFVVYRILLGAGTLILLGAGVLTA